MELEGRTQGEEEEKEAEEGPHLPIEANEDWVVHGAGLAPAIREPGTQHRTRSLS
jgi:hypothetical protein